MAGIEKHLTVDEAKAGLVTRADEFIRSSQHAVERIAGFGSRHIRDGDTILTHCNSEVALGCIIAAHKEGKEIEVFATEVRPRNQGLITIKTLNDAGIKTNFIVDSAVRSFIHDVDLVVVGADAVTVNGAVVNKIGTSQVAHAAVEARVNVMVAAETYKFAPRTILGELIKIEERAGSEVLPDEIAKTLPNVTVRNPAFDVTPAEYIDLIVTEKGAIPPQMAYVIIRDYLGWEIGEFGDPLMTGGLNNEYPRLLYRADAFIEYEYQMSTGESGPACYRGRRNYPWKYLLPNCTGTATISC
jgi:ribose 1,5-bisphosphate isomerase